MASARDCREGCAVENSVLRQVSLLIGIEFRDLGRELDVSEYDIEAIEFKEREMGLKEVAYKILHKWKNREGRNATKDKLIECLINVNRKDITETICSKDDELCNSFQALSTELNENNLRLLTNLQEKLKDSYTMIVLKGLPWMEDVNITLKEYYVELKIIQQDENGVDKPEMSIQLNQIFENSGAAESKPNRILVVGAPGYGKTSFGYKLCYDFALGIEYVKQFDVVLLLPLREFFGDLKKMLIEVSGVSNSNAADFLSLLNNKTVKSLIILEGYDELSTAHKPVINSLIKGDVFSHVTVIVTSRPGLFDSEKECKSKLLTSRDVKIPENPFTFRIRITGIPETKLDEFSEKHLRKFPYEVRSLVSRKLRELIQKHVVSKSFLQCPLFLLMVILLLSDDKCTNLTKLQSTTHLYKEMMNFIIRRYLMKTNLEFSEVVDLFSVHAAHRPPHVDLLVQFGKFSVDALKSNKLSFSHDMTEKYSSGDASIVDLGLLNKIITISGFLKKSYYEPVHKSLLEFAAAYFLWTEFRNGPGEQWKRTVCFFRPRNHSESSLVFCFLMGMMNDKAHIIFQVLNPYAIEFNSDFGLLCSSLLEVNITPALLSSLSCSLSCFLPNKWTLGYREADRNFSFSPQSKEILDFGLTNQIIKEIQWFTSESCSLPNSVKVNTMDLIMGNTFASISDFQCKRITCTILNCEFQENSPTSNIWPAFISLLPSFDFQQITFAFYNTSSSIHLPMLHSVAFEGLLRNVIIRRIYCELAKDCIPLLSLITDFVQKEKIEGISVDLGDDHLLNKQLLQEQIDCLVSSSSKSRLLQKFLMNNFQTQNLTVDLTRLCNKGQKSWEYIWLGFVDVNYTEEIQHADFKIQNLSFNNCNTTNMVCCQLLESCRLSSLRCDSAILHFCPSLVHLTELSVYVNELIISEKFQFSCFKSIKILCLIIESFRYTSFSISVEQWLLQLIGDAFNLKGLEIHQAEENYDLAVQLMETVFKYFGERILVPSSLEPSLNPSTSVSQQTMLDYILFFFSDNDVDEKYSSHVIELLSNLKQLLRKNVFSRWEIVARDIDNLFNFPSTRKYNATCLSDIFSPAEGFQLTQDFWGTREDDSQHGRQEFDFTPFVFERVSISVSRKI